MKVRELGSFIREQRKGASMSLRKLAKQAGVSNPYLSQIERGLRRPSAEILQAIAKALQISSETLYVQAGILDERVGTDVKSAILNDSALTRKQKDVLVSIYDSFRQGGGAAEETARSEMDLAGLGEAEAAAATTPRTGSKKKKTSRRKPSAKAEGAAG